MAVTWWCGTVQSRIADLDGCDLQAENCLSCFQSSSHGKCLVAALQQRDAQPLAHPDGGNRKYAAYADNQKGAGLRHGGDCHIVAAGP